MTSHLYKHEQVLIGQRVLEAQRLHQLIDHTARKVEAVALACERTRRQRADVEQLLYRERSGGICMQVDVDCGCKLIMIFILL